MIIRLYLKRMKKYNEIRTDYRLAVRHTPDLPARVDQAANKAELILLDQHRDRPAAVAKSPTINKAGVC